MKNYDLIIIGGGSAGIEAALNSSVIGKKILLIEKNKIGNSYQSNRYLPLKIFNHLVKQGHQDHIFDKISYISKELFQYHLSHNLEKYNIDIILGHAEFIDQYHISVNNNIFYGKNIIISTGSLPVIPSISGLESIPYYTHDNFFTLESIPKSLIIVGAGLNTIELSLPLAKLGTNIYILEKNKHILPSEDTIIQSSIMKIIKESGISIFTDIDILNVSYEDKKIIMHFNQHNIPNIVTADTLLFCSGRVPNTNINLDAAQIIYHPQKGIIVNSYMQTSQHHIYAIGDVVNPEQIFYMADTHADIAVHNIFHPLLKKKLNVVSPILGLYITPEYSRCGLNKKEARKKYKHNFEIHEKTKYDINRALMASEKNFFLQILTHKNHIIGASCIGENAGEIISMIQIIIENKIPLPKLESSIQSYPSYGDAIKQMLHQTRLSNISPTLLMKIFKKNTNSS